LYDDPWSGGEGDDEHRKWASLWDTAFFGVWGAVVVCDGVVV
jgi:hypothetical protein